MFGYLERQMFKAIPGGYIFQPPPPTRFHRTQAYVVNEAQKEEIEVINRRGRIFWLRTVTLTAIALALATRVLIDTHGRPLWLAAYIGACVWLIAQILGIVLVLDLKLRQLEPVLAGLPHSDEWLFPELRDQILFGPSPRYATIWCTLFALMLGDRFEQHPPFTDVLSTAYLIALAMNLFWALRGPPAARAEGHAGGPT